MSLSLTEAPAKAVQIVDRKVVQFKCVGYPVWVRAYNKIEKRAEEFQIEVAAPGDYSVRRVIKESLGDHWTVTKWNTGELAA